MTEPPGPLLASGRAADVYDLGDGTVLRRYRSGRHDLEFEAKVMRHVADTGYPVPAVHSVEGNDLVMERIDGITMFDRLTAAPWTLPVHARTLARLQQRLARIPAPSWIFSEADASRPPQSMLHLDLHPMNVMLSPDGPVVIDWTNAAGGPAGFDAAITHVRVTTFATSSLTDRIGQQLFARTFRRVRGRRLVDGYREAACDHLLADAG